MNAVTIRVPDSFRAMPRWRAADTVWLDALPDSIADACARFGLSVDGAPLHGSNALVVPVLRGEERLALRLTPRTEPVADQIAALAFWDSRGTVRLVDADVDAGLMLLERLDASQSLAALPLSDAVPAIARVMRRLAVPAPPEARSTAAMAAKRAAGLEPDWLAFAKPFERSILDAAVGTAALLSTTDATTAANGDLHYGQVLAGAREPWLVVDPVLLRGDPDVDIARLLWTRLDEMPTAADIVHWFDVIVSVAALDRERAAAWTVFRCVDYWLWGLGNGLTEDPLRCRRILEAFSWF